MKTANDALFVARFAAQFAALDLAALSAKLNATLGLGLLAAVAAQQRHAKNCRYRDQ